MSSRNTSSRGAERPPPLLNNAVSLWQSQLFRPVDSEVDAIKIKLDSGSSSTSITQQDFSASDEMLSLSDDDLVSTFTGHNAPKLSLPILYEDEENPVPVKITCKKCLDMESILRNFRELYTSALEPCKDKERRDGFWECISNWNNKLQSNLETLKTHLIGEFIVHIEQAPLSEFKEDHEFRVQFNNYRLLFSHMKSMEDRFNQRREELNCPIRETFNINTSDKILKDLQTKISSSRRVLQQLEQRIRSIAKSWENARADTNPRGFGQAIFTKEDYIFNRLFNIFSCIEFLEQERAFYEKKIEASKPVKKPFLPLLQLKQKKPEDLCPKPCNVKRRPQNSVKRKLPSSIAHFYPFTKTQYMDEIHASWYRTFLRPEDIRREIGQQRETNLRVLTDINQLKKDIHQLEVQLKMKDFAEQTMKSERDEDDIMFPEKVNKASSFLDFNSLY